MTKVYWIENNVGGGIGTYKTEEEAQKAIEFWQNKSVSNSWSVKEYEAGTCRTCGRIERADLLADFGECMSCEKLRGDVEADARSERIELDENVE